jgi:predicted XRE-type DNA-binding protein
MAKKQMIDISVSAGSGNVFADLGFAEPEEELAKAQLASHIRQVIKRRRLTQVAAATLIGIDQPKVSALLNGRLANFSTERLMRLLTTLGQDIEIVVREKPSGLERGKIRVLGEAHA